MSFLSKLADLMILNVITLICCVPIVTVGASLSSMYYVLLRLRQEETSFVTKDFFHAFRQNLKAVTFSYDDGVTQDIRLIEMLNRYNLKCTFNLNSE